MRQSQSKISEKQNKVIVTSFALHYKIVISDNDFIAKLIEIYF